MLNGRAFQDKNVGEFTFCNKRGKSAIDFVLCNKAALYKIVDFYIKPFNSFSDHCIVGFDVKYTKNNYLHLPASMNPGEKINITRWNEDKRNDYVDKINSDIVHEKIAFLADNLLENMNSETIETSIDQLNSIFITAGKDHIKEVYIGGESKGRNKNVGDQWYDQECVRQCKIFKECESRFWETGSEEDRIFMCQQRSINR